jgi:hypothetical protein
VDRRKTETRLGSLEVHRVGGQGADSLKPLPKLRRSKMAPSNTNHKQKILLSQIERDSLVRSVIYRLSNELRKLCLCLFPAMAEIKPNIAWVAKMP